MTDAYVPRAFPISIKGVLLDQDERVLLLKNERQEWELPGGKLELDEEPTDRVVQEILEESGWKATAGPLLDVWMYQPVPGKHVFIVTYGCTLFDDVQAGPVVSSEHKEAGLFRRSEVAGLTMPQGYKDSIERWFDHTDRK